MRAKGSVAVDRDKKRWIIECEPHVMQRLKRVFEGIPKAALGRCPLADTPTNADELRWFLQRYPLSLSPADRAYLDARADAAAERQSIVERVLEEGYKPRAFELALPPREYQRFAADLAIQQGFLLVADDMGTGKTVSAICALSDPTARPAIVVCGPNIIRQWVAQIERFLPGTTVYVARTTKPADLTVGPRGTKLPFPDVVVLTYERLVGWAETLAGLGFKTIIYDEVQAFRHRLNAKREYTNRYATGLFLRGHIPIRVGLSGTPIYNYGGEIHNVVSILDEEALGTREEFCRDHCDSTSETAKVKDPKALGLYLRERGVMVRRTMADVGRELPKLTTIVHTVDTDGASFREAGSGVAELAKRILRKGGLGIDKMTDGRELDARLRHTTGLAKAPAVAAFVRILVEEDRKVVLFGWHKSVYKVWNKLLCDLGVVFFTGDETPNQKARAIEAFTKGSARVLVMSLRAAEGVDGLQYVSSTVVYGELDASPKVMAQDTARVSRDGQVSPVQAFVLVSDDGSDPVYLDLLGLKTAQADGIMDPTKDVVEQQLDDDRIAKLAEAWLAQHDPAGLAAVHAENARLAAEEEAAKQAQRDARDAERETRALERAQRGHAPSPAPVPSPLASPAPLLDVDAAIPPPAHPSPVEKPADCTTPRAPVLHVVVTPRNAWNLARERALSRVQH